MAAQVEFELVRMRDAFFDHCARINILGSTASFRRRHREETRVMTFLCDDQRDGRLVIGTQFVERLADADQFGFQDLKKLK